MSCRRRYDNTCMLTHVGLARKMGSGNKRKSATGGGGGRPIAASQPAALYPENSGQHGQGQGQAGAGGGGASVGSSGGGSGNVPGSGSTSYSGSGASSGGSFTRSAAAKADEQGDGPRPSAEARPIVGRTEAAARDAQLARRGQRPLGAQVRGQAGIALCSEVLAASSSASRLRRGLTKVIRRGSGLGPLGFCFLGLLRVAPYFDTRPHSIRIRSRRCLRSSLGLRRRATKLVPLLLRGAIVNRTKYCW